MNFQTYRIEVHGDSLAELVEEDGDEGVIVDTLAVALDTIIRSERRPEFKPGYLYEIEVSVSESHDDET